MNRRVVMEKKIRLNKQKGASLVEYALTVALICVVSIISINSVGELVTERFEYVNNEFNAGNLPPALIDPGP